MSDVPPPPPPRFGAVPPAPGAVPPAPLGPSGAGPDGGDGGDGPRRGLLIGVVVAILAGIGVAGFFALRDDDTSSAPDDSIVSEAADTEPDDLVPTVPDDPDVTSPEITIPDFTLPTLPELSTPDFTFPEQPGTLAPPGSIPEATEPPDGLGDDATLDALARDCFDGAMDACDALYDQSDAGTDYQRYGDTCAGRQPENTQVYCESAFPS